MRRNVTCKFTTRKEKQENLKRTQYVKTLEERLKKTESLLIAAGLLDEEAIGYDDISDDDGDEEQSEVESDVDSDPDYSSNDGGRSPDELTGDEGTRHPAYIPGDRDPMSISCTTPGPVKPFCSLNPATQPKKGKKRAQPCTNSQQCCPPIRGDSKEDSRYYGRSSSLSILSRDGIEWIKNKTGGAAVLAPIFSNTNHDSPWNYWRPDVFHDVFSSKVFKPLPPRAEVFSLLGDYFRTVNRLFPLYHEETFMQLVEWQYTQQTCDDAARWASINIILSLAYEYRFSNSQKSEKDREKAWLYYKNAMSVFAELTLRRTDLLSVQALLGMALFLRGNSGTQSALPTITAAIRSCQRMGLHRDLPRPHLSAVEQEQRKRVFWIAYILDQSSCIRVGSAPAQHPDDFDVGFPSETAEDKFVSFNNLSFFRQLCHMTVIKSRIYSKLYSAKALHNKSPTETCEIVRELHTELEEWKSADPFSQQNLKQRGAGDDFLMGFACAGLQFVYYNCLIMIHRLPLVIHFAYMHRLASGGRVQPDSMMILSQASASTVICAQAARDTLKLVNNLPWGDVAWIWSLLYYIFLAVMTIFVSILRDPKSPDNKEDLQSLNMAATFFATLIPGDRPCTYARFMTRMCANFDRIARMVLDREQRTVKPGDKSHSDQRSLPTGQASDTAASDDDERSSTSTSPAVHPSISTGVSIPNLEGLPRINSSGYVVPDSPSDIPDNNTNTNIPLNTSIPSAPTNNNTTSSSSLENISMLPFSISDNLAPDLWQIPLTADWELGNQFWGGVFGPPGTSAGGFGEVPGNPSTGSGSGTGNMSHSQPPPQAPMNMGFGFPDGGGGGGLPFGAPAQPMWSYGPFFDPF
ncbi:transcription factor domain-containing protein [Aspergillus affinis]|uniref:transcription factor domain-containing protein n=1 Tax=Aspergillus affinis TaxID=1070780 RepID=UPI0022FEDAEC|nr:uncharacterized protein KD926_010680 [Aspergillus affinis]KAI9038551.1 hypothetical protein KD926_010680 [Aspergillus affinis]